MRPILLQIGGLQSYREVQEIDFGALTGAGVFGIFGPTGSGKSTLLDAITLALYGKVERAPGGTQAVMNQAEDTLSVSFTFELATAGGSERYRVDRQFKRNGELSMLGSLCRLIRYEQGETIVLADKAGEVNQHVQELLGLSMADFTRAVVLPQGKFAEFLTLAGKDRRAMLQRLFHLEPYGDRLSAKTASRYKAADAAVKELQAEQQGLGDASAEALALAETRLAEAREACARVRERLAACELRAAEQRAVRELQREHAAVTAREAALAADAPRVAALAARLARAGEAERLRPLVRRRAAAAAQAQAAREAAAAATAAAERAAQALAAAQAAHEAARDALAAQEGPLAARLEQLRQAAELAAELAAARDQLAAQAAEAARGEAQLAAQRAEQARERELREKALHRQAQLKAELARVETPAAYRKRLQEALQAARELERTAALAAERQTAAAARAAEAEEQRRLLQELAEQERDGERRTLEWAERLMALHNDAAAGERRMALLEQAAAREGERVRARLKAAEAEAMAAALAAHLHDGGACPVCGSTEHPNPASHRPEGGDGTAAATDGGEVSPEALEACRQELREGRFHARRLLDKLESLEKQWAQQAAADGVPAAETPASILKLREAGQARLEAAAAVAEEAEVRTTAAFEQALAAHSDVTQGLEREIEALERSWQTLLQDRRQSAKRRQELEARLQSVQSLVDAESRKAQEWTDTRSRLRDQWQASYAEWEPEQLPELAGQLERSDAAAEDIRQRLAKSVTFLEEQQVRLEQLHKELADAEKLAVRTAAEQEALQRQIGQRQERLFALVGDGDANKLTLEANGALSKLRADAATAASLRDQAQAAHQSAASQAAAAVQAEQSAAALERETQNEWEQQSLAAGFASAAEVEDALIAEAQRGEWAAEVEAHGKQEHQLAVRRQELEQALAGRHVSDEAWDALEQELALCKAEDEAALQTSAKAERDCEDVRAKHGRWLELEQKRAALQAELTLLGKLQSVLRGNAFVEFLAEEQLMHVSRAASERLGQLTRRKYAIEVDSGGGFVIRDDANGGTRRPVTTLSGGETFLTSLSLALALSTQIQLKGEYPLEFFFLDEGFGTLDPELLDAVVTALEKLHLDNLTVGVISHVPELRARLPRRLVVQPAEPGGRGSRVTLETM